MNVNIDMLLKDGAKAEISEDLDNWAGMYLVAESSGYIIKIKKCTRKVVLMGLEHTDYKDCSGLVDYYIYSRNKSRGHNRYWGSQRSSGFYPYYEGDTFGDFIKWMRDNEGFTLQEKITDLNPYSEGDFYD